MGEGPGAIEAKHASAHASNGKSNVIKLGAFESTGNWVGISIHGGERIV
jgi:hypothetical protein